MIAWGEFLSLLDDDISSTLHDRGRARVAGQELEETYQVDRGG